MVHIKIETCANCVVDRINGAKWYYFGIRKLNISVL